MRAAENSSKGEFEEEENGDEEKNWEEEKMQKLISSSLISLVYIKRKSKVK